MSTEPIGDYNVCRHCGEYVHLSERDHSCRSGTMSAPILEARAEQCHGLCDPECEGRCPRECHADLVRDLLAELRTLREQEKQQRSLAEVYGDAVARWRPIVERAESAEHELVALREELARLTK